MSRIDDLIVELCPNGVEFKALGDVTTKGANIKWANAGDTEFRYIDLSSVDRTTRTIGETATITAANAPSRAQQIVRAGDVAFATTRPSQMRWAVIPPEYDRQIASTGYCVMRPDTTVVLTNFLAHTLGTDTFGRYIEANQVAGNYPSIPDSRVRAYRIPVPPLQAQREIVRILDKFTQLEAELEAELEARRCQYEHYRGVLFGFSDQVKRIPLSEICESISAGGDLPLRFAKGQSTPSDEFPFPIFSNGTGDAALYGFTDSYRIDREAVTISARGTIGFHAVRAPKFTPIIRLLTLVPDPKWISVRFLNYALAATEIGHSGGSIPQLTVPAVKRIMVPVPSLLEQERIVAVLDKFDPLVNDLAIGLPAEITARRKQYEYYRDRLLSFEEVEA